MASKCRQNSRTAAKTCSFFERSEIWLSSSWLWTARELDSRRAEELMLDLAIEDEDGLVWFWFWFLVRFPWLPDTDWQWQWQRALKTLNCCADDCGLVPPFSSFWPSKDGRRDSMCMGHMLYRHSCCRGSVLDFYKSKTDGDTFSCALCIVHRDLCSDTRETSTQK